MFVHLRVVFVTSSLLFLFFPLLFLSMSADVLLVPRSPLRVMCVFLFFFVLFRGSQPDQYKQMSVPISKGGGRGRMSTSDTGGRSGREKIKRRWD